MKKLLLATSLLLPACTDTDVKPQEPVAPQADTTAYPEDPQLAPKEEPAEAPDPSDFDADTGALTDDPFGAPKNVPKMDDRSDNSLKDVPETPADQLNIPADEGMDSAAKAGGDQNLKKQGAATPAVPEAHNPSPKYPDRKHPAAVDAAPAAEGGVVTRYVVPKKLNVRAQPTLTGKVLRQVDGGAKLVCKLEGSYCELKPGEYVRESELTAVAPKKAAAPKRAAKHKKAQP